MRKRNRVLVVERDKIVTATNLIRWYRSYDFGLFSCRQTLVVDLCYVGANNIGDGGLEVILTSKVSSQLDQFGIYGNGITPYGLRYFLTANLNNLKKLVLDYNKLGWRGVQHLAKSDLPQINYLSLKNCKLTAQSIKELTKGQWKNLKDLSILDNNEITPGFLPHLNIVSWKLSKILTSFVTRLSIHYLSAVVRPQTGQEGQLNIFTWISKKVKPEGNEILLNSNTIIASY